MPTLSERLGRLWKREYAIVMVATAVLVQVSLFFVAARVTNNKYADFRAFYGAGVAVRSGAAPRLYDYETERRLQDERVGLDAAPLPFVYPPFAALPFAVLSRLPYPQAIAVWQAFDVLLACYAAWLLLRVAEVPRGDRALAFATCLAFPPVGVAVIQGQMSFILLLAFIGCHLSLRAERPFRGGLCLAMALIKFPLALPTALLFLLWRNRQLVLGFSLGGLALGLVSLAVTGRAGLVGYLHSLGSLGRSVSDGVGYQRYQLAPRYMPNLHGLTSLLLGTTPASFILTIAISVALLARTALRRPSVAQALTCSILVSFYMFQHDLTLLLLPLAVLSRGLLFAPAAAPGRTDRMPIPEQDQDQDPGQGPSRSSDQDAGRRSRRLRAACLILVWLPPIYIQLGAASLLALFVGQITLLYFLLDRAAAPSPSRPDGVRTSRGAERPAATAPALAAQTL